jgi:putative chitinase
MSGTKHLYDTVRPMFGGHLLQSQIDGIETILNAVTAAGITDNRKTAYMLGTVFHECAKTMQPIEEFGKGAGHPYGKKLKEGKAGHHIPYTMPDELYYGRGYVQLTWYENYEAMGHLLQIPLLVNPALALVPQNAANIMIKGMMGGIFTGVSLNKYFTNTKTDWINARKIINGLDQAAAIAGYAQAFYKGLTTPA